MENNEKLKKVSPFLDDRGLSYFDLFGDLLPDCQINYSKMNSGVVKAFHFHEKQEDNWMVVGGNAKVILVYPKLLDNPDAYSSEDLQYMIDNGKLVLATNGYYYEPVKIEKYFIGENNPQILNIPKGVFHGLTPIGDKGCDLLYFLTNKYNPADPDEIRVAWDSFGGLEMWDVEFK